MMHDQVLKQFRFRIEQFRGWAAANPSDANADVEKGSQLLAGLIFSAGKLRDDGCQIFGAAVEKVDEQSPLIERFRRLPSECGPVQSVTRFCPAQCRERGLACCLADIHHKLSAGVHLYENGEHAAARSLWRFGYLHSWGKLCICALFVLHSSMQEAHSYDAERPAAHDPTGSPS